MKPLLFAGLVGGLFALPLVSSAPSTSWVSAPAQDGTVDVGSKPEYTFREAPVNSMGVMSLEALRGKPVLVEFWGPN